ncbi:hypothetical protein CSC33_1671 [Pseudomonas aeruginosa]|nr:hypothetical protein CSC33_1671 [Pseudomonas aeruginosa]
MRAGPLAGESHARAAPYPYAFSVFPLDRSWRLPSQHNLL